MKITARLLVEVTIVEVFAVEIAADEYGHLVWGGRNKVSIEYHRHNGRTFSAPDWGGPVVGSMCVDLLFCFCIILCLIVLCII